MVKRVSVLGMLSVLSICMLVLIGEASTRSSYVCLIAKRGNVTLVKHLNKMTTKKLSLSTSNVYRQIGKKTIHGTTYVKLKHLNGNTIGWILKRQVKPLKHVSKKGYLRTFSVRRLNGQLRLKGTSRTVCVDIQGPQATVKQMRYRHVAAKVLVTSRYQVTKQVKTDFGKYYQLQHDHQNYGWVKATAFNYESLASVRQSAITPTTLQRVQSLVTSNHLHGTLLMTKNGPQDAVTQSYGYANWQNKTLNATNMAYPIASLQKAITGAMIGQLVQSHQLSLQTTLDKFYPQLKFASKITIRQLLDHQSGLKMNEITPPRVLNESEAIHWTLQHVTSTGQYRWEYTNANFTILAGIIRQVTKKSYWDNLQQRIVRPLGLTSVYDGSNLPTNYDMKAYWLNPIEYSQAHSLSKALLSSELGAGNLLMSVSDYERFVWAYNQKKLLTAANYRLLTNQSQPYSAGYYYSKSNLQNANGGDNGIRSFYYGTRNSQISIVFFINQGDFAVAKHTVVEIENLLKQD